MLSVVDRALGTPTVRHMNAPAGSSVFVQRFVNKLQFYSAALVTARFVADLAGEGLEHYESVIGTAFMVRREDALYFVTNRHVLDYNYKRENPIKSVALKSVEIRGHAQPADISQPTVPWTYTHPTSSGITFHPDNSTDLAVIRINRGDAFAPPLLSLVRVLSVYDAMEGWLASKSEIDGLWPGEEVFLVGYPGLAGVSERPVLVSGIISSDPRYPAVFGNATNLGNAVLCQSFSWRGMSGAPVLGFSESIGKTKIIGINAGHVGGVGGGIISHFVRSDALIDLLWHNGRSNGGLARAVERVPPQTASYACAWETAQGPGRG